MRWGEERVRKPVSYGSISGNKSLAGIARPSGWCSRGCTWPVRFPQPPNPVARHPSSHPFEALLLLEPLGAGTGRTIDSLLETAPEAAGSRSAGIEGADRHD